ncbi:MAG: tRNA (guanosine(46)-N7)-methyltransferase TrmB [Planctomycetota bacterium]
MATQRISTAAGQGAEGCLDLARLFGNDGPVEADLGCGKGRFLVQEAASRPEVNFLGVDRLTRKLLRALRRADARGLTNVRLLRVDVKYFVNVLLPRESVSVFHVYFPDPWPKKKHKKHRFLNPSMLIAMEAALVPGGTIRLLTDNREYFEQMQEMFKEAPAFEQVDLPSAKERKATDFEEEFKEKRISFYGAAYRKKPSEGEGLS